MSEYPLTSSFDILLKFTASYDAPESGGPVYLNFGDAVSTDNAQIAISAQQDDVSILNDLFPLEGSFDILLRFVTPYSQPADWQDIALSFGVTGDLEIIANATEIKVECPNHLVDEVTLIDTDAAEIKTKSSRHEVEIIVEIDTDLNQIRIQSAAHLVEHLPDILTSTNQVALNFTDHSVSGGAANDLPTGGSPPGLRSAWKKAENYVDRGHGFPWADPGDRRIRTTIPWDITDDLSKHTRSGFVAKMPLEDIRQNIPWSDFGEKSDYHTKSPHIGIMTYTDGFEKVLWGSFKWIERDTTNAYTNTQGINGEFKDVHKRKSWDKPEHYDFHKRNTFDNDIREQFKTRHHGTYWGPYWYSMWCQEKFFPYNSDEEVQLVLKTDVPFMSNPDFVTPKNARCPFAYWYSGGRDSFKPIIDPSDQIFAERRKVYYMLNSAFIKRLPDNAAVDFQSVSMSIDRNSWSWDFNITLMSRDALELVWPVDDTLIDIEININGWKWTCRVENWSESVSFGQRAWSVSGRSPSVELGEPYLVEPSFANSEEHGGQIVDSILENTGWSATWSHDDFNPHLDWLVPASTLNMYDSSKIDQMQSVVQAVGAFLQTVPDTNTSQEFTIHPTYKRNPWNWGSQITPTVFLNDDVCYEYGRSNDIIKSVNSIIVSGESTGVIVDATKDGTAGDSPAAMIIEQLMTTQEAARERARHEIGKTGFWINHSMRLFSLMPPGEAPGLMLPGTFINMSETGFSAWVGQVTGTQISAAWSNGLEVSQQIEVEQFYG